MALDMDLACVFTKLLKIDHEQEPYFLNGLNLKNQKVETIVL